MVITGVIVCSYTIAYAGNHFKPKMMTSVIFVAVHKSYGDVTMFYERFEQLCKLKGVSPNRACIEMGISRSTAAKWKNTGGKASADSLFKMAAYFGVPVSYFNEDGENENSPAGNDANGAIPGFDELSEANQAIVRSMIDQLLAAQSNQ